MAIMMMAGSTLKAQSIPSQITSLIYRTDTTIDAPYKHPSPGFVYKPNTGGGTATVVALFISHIIFLIHQMLY